MAAIVETPDPAGGPAADRSAVSAYFGAPPHGLRSQVHNLVGLLARDIVLMVPRYQRPYTWTEELIAQLIQDLRRAWERNGVFYFIGHFVLVKTDKNELQIADGQQRLATLTMIFAYVRERLAHRAAFFQSLILMPDGRARLRLRPADAGFMFEYVQQPGRFFDLTKVEDLKNDSQICLSTGAETVCNALADMSEQDLEQFAKFVCRCALFDVIEADEPGGAAVVFTTVNDRGLDLSAADLMKSSLLERATISEQEKDQAAAEWEDLEDRLGRRAFGELLELTPVMFEGEAILAPGDLGAFVQSLEVKEGVDGFLREWLPRHGQALFEIRNEKVPGPHAIEINRRIRCLKQLKDQTWLPLAVSFLADHGKDHGGVRAFFRGIDLIAYSALLSAVRSEAREARWKKALAARGDERKLFNSENGALALREGERRLLIERLGKSFKRDKSKESEKRKLILIRVNACLPGGESLTRDMDLTVEHILPVRGGEEWSGAFDERMREEYPHLVGNWTLVTLNQNQRCGAKGFAAKKRIFFEEGSPVWAVTRTIERVQEWTFETIESRREEFQRALFRDWGI